MFFDITITLANTVFWVALHFGIAFLITGLAAEIQAKMMNPNRKFFQVSEKEMRFYRAIRLPKWKDKLPQYNRDFDKRHLKKEAQTEYLRAFVQMTCKAEAIHLMIAVLGYLSVLFCLFFDSPKDMILLFAAIATGIGAVNLVYCMIQRYNRKRLVRVLKRKEKARDI